MELATLYIRRDGKAYRLKCFENMLMIEQQPNGENIPFPREGLADSVYDADTLIWDYEGIGTLIDIYNGDSIPD